MKTTTFTWSIGKDDQDINDYIVDLINKGYHIQDVIPLDTNHPYQMARRKTTKAIIITIHEDDLPYNPHH